MNTIKDPSADLAVIRFLENTIMGNKEKYSVECLTGTSGTKLVAVESYDLYLKEPKTLLMTIFNYEEETPHLVYAVVYEKECIISIRNNLEQRAVMNLLHQFSNPAKANDIVPDVVKYLETF